MKWMQTLSLTNRSKKLYGDSEELKKLFNFWMPRHTISDKTYDTIFLSIDEKQKRNHNEFYTI